MHFYKFIPTLLIGFLFFIDCSSINSSKSTTKNIYATAPINAASGSSVSGLVSFVDSAGSVYLTADVDGLSEGKHAIHIHEFGDCSTFDAKSAGGHWNPTHTTHGEWDNHHFHLGDIGNIDADTSGNGKISLKTDLWCLGCEDSTKNILGKSIIIHEGEDDFTSQPSGNAGPRVGCGVIVLDQTALN